METQLTFLYCPFLCDLAELSYYKRFVVAKFCHLPCVPSCCLWTLGEDGEDTFVSFTSLGCAQPFPPRCDVHCTSFRRCLLPGWASLVAQVVKTPSAVQDTWVRFLGREDLLEQGMATHSSPLAWRIPWTEEPGRLQSMGSQRAGHDWTTNTHTNEATKVRL